MPETRTPYQPKIAGKDRQQYTRGEFSSGDFIYPGKLVFNEVTESQLDSIKGVHQWEQHIHEQHRAFSDGNPGRQINSVLLQNPKTKQIIWEGSDADQLAQAYEEVCGCDMLPDNPDSAEFLNHYFNYKSVKVPDTEKVYRQIPTEYLGPDYVYEGTVETIGGGDGAAPEEEPEEDSEALALVVSTLDGMSAEEVRGGAMFNIVKAEGGPFKDVKSVLGVSVRGGFVPPRAILLDKLVEAGYIVIEDGVIKAGAPPAEEGE